MVLVCIHHSKVKSRRPWTTDIHCKQSSICNHVHTSLSLSAGADDAAHVVVKLFSYLYVQMRRRWKLIKAFRVSFWLRRLLSFVTSVSLLAQWFDKLNSQSECSLSPGAEKPPMGVRLVPTVWDTPTDTHQQPDIARQPTVSLVCHSHTDMDRNYVNNSN